MQRHRRPPIAQIIRMMPREQVERTPQQPPRRLLLDLRLTQLGHLVAHFDIPLLGRVRLRKDDVNLLERPSLGLNVEQVYEWEKAEMILRTQAADRRRAFTRGSQFQRTRKYRSRRSYPA